MPLEMRLSLLGCCRPPAFPSPSSACYSKAQQGQGMGTRALHAHSTTHEKPQGCIQPAAGAGMLLPRAPLRSSPGTAPRWHPPGDSHHSVRLPGFSNPEMLKDSCRPETKGTQRLQLAQRHPRQTRAMPAPIQLTQSPILG